MKIDEEKIVLRILINGRICHKNFSVILPDDYWECAVNGYDWALLSRNASEIGAGKYDFTSLYDYTCCTKFFKGFSLLNLLKEPQRPLNLESFAFVLLGKSEKSIEALHQVVLPLGCKPENVSSAYVKDRSNVATGFEIVSKLLQQTLERHDSQHVTVVVDQVYTSCLTPLDTDWEGIVSSLIIAFPSVHWVFAVMSDDDGMFASFNLNSLARRVASEVCDGSGLRNWIRKVVSKTKDDEGRLIAPYIPLRKNLAVALDDEESYAYFNAYIAYRFGVRSFPVCTDAQAKAILKREETDLDILPGPPTLTFEDICISYPDGSDEIHYSDLGSEKTSSRKKQLPLLDKAAYRIFVTTQHRQAGHPGKNELNQFYIDSGLCVVNSKEPNRYGKLILKPYSGMFDLWRRAKLDRKLLWWDEKGKRFRRGVGEGYVWPPQEQRETDEDTGHSAPGRLLMIATHMIKRCEKLLPSVRSVQDAVLCAVLATDALELLGNRTPTTAMDALRLKHLAEVTAECQFSGVEYKIEMKARLKELRRDAEHIGRWFDRRRQKMAAMNAEMTTLVDILKVLRAHGQFDEIQICQNRIRYLHNRLWMRQKPIRYFVWPVLVYSEFVLKSFLAFSFAIFVWFIIITGLFYLASTTKSPFFLHLPAAWAQACKDSLERFITLKEFKGSNTTWWCLVSAFASVLSITHIGLFISHLHLILKRKE